ncbi:arginine decarboxylase, partial [Faecalibacillus intestinalis]|nr:arginine decarboxylase [Faecalibacillus intestinalis]
MASVNPKEKIILNRDCHQSAINSCIIGDIDPIYVNPSINKNSNTLSGVSFDDVKRVIDSNLDAKAVFL